MRSRRVEHPRRGARVLHVVPAGTEPREEARTLARVTGDAVLVHLHEQRVGVAVGEDASHVLHVSRRLALAPERLAASATRSASARWRGWPRGRGDPSTPPSAPRPCPPPAPPRARGPGRRRPRRRSSWPSRTSTPCSRRNVFASAIVWLAEVEDRRGQHGVGAALHQPFAEMVERARAARGDDRNGHRLGHRARRARCRSRPWCRRDPCW